MNERRKRPPRSTPTPRRRSESAGEIDRAVAELVAQIRSQTVPCSNCDDTGWVCEAHPDKPWDGSPRKCGCGQPGAPCRKCNVANEDNPPRLPPDFEPHD